MKRPFQVGDRVRKYGVSGLATPIDVDGIIKKIYLDGTIELDCGNPIAREIAHPKQCRRLINKPRKRVWIHFYSDGTSKLTTKVTDSDLCSSCVEFIEVKKK